MSRVPTEIRVRVFERAKGVCEYCLSQEAFCPDSFAIEQIYPNIKGGDDQLENLALSCQGCNNHKYTATIAIDPVTGNEVDLYNPRSDEWRLHFQWSGDYSELIGLSPKGRASIARLCLNRSPVVNLRKALSKAGCHPPGLE